MTTNEEMSAAFKSPIPSQSTDEEYGEIYPPRAVNEVLHRMYVLKAGAHTEARMAVPFAQIVEARVVGARPLEEGRKGLVVMIGITYKLRTRSA